MAELDPMRPHDTTEAAYRDALLGDDAGREQRRARLMAALPQPSVPAAVPVARSQLAWRWSPYALGLAAMGMLLVALLALRSGRDEPKPATEPRLAAAPPASAAVVVAQADPVAEAGLAPAPRPAAAKVAPPKPRETRPVVVADASSPSPAREAEAVAMVVPPPPPAAPVAAAPPPPLAAAKPIPPAMPAAAAPSVQAEASPPAASRESDVLARVEVSGSRARAPLSVNSLAPSGAAGVRTADGLPAPDAALLKAVLLSDAEAVRAALQAGASVHQRDALGRTMLMLAARAGAREVVDLLLASGARAADRDAQGWTAADHARDRGHGELAERLR